MSDRWLCLPPLFASCFPPLPSEVHVPGPGNYGPGRDLDSVKTRAPAFSMMGRSSKDGLPGGDTPGPGAYGPDASRIKQKAPAYSLPARNFAPEGGSVAPGPGAYSAAASVRSPKVRGGGGGGGQACGCFVKWWQQQKGPAHVGCPSGRSLCKNASRGNEWHIFAHP